jgi:hypothetical protein
MNKFNFYINVEEAVRSGVTYGYRRAYKHNDSPSEEEIKDSICDSVMIELEDVIDYDLMERAVDALLRAHNLTKIDKTE